MLLGSAICPHVVADESSAGDPGVPRAVKPSLTYNSAAFANVSGGLREGGTYTSNLNLQLDIDTAVLIGWPNTIAHLDGLWLQGGQPSNLVGDAQGVSNISAPNTAKLYEAWLQKNFLGNRLSVLAGLYDLSSEFYRLQSAGLFLNSSFGTGPEFAQSGVGGPSIFPDTSVGMRVAFKPADGVVIRGAVLDGVPVNRPDGSRAVFKGGDGGLIVAELDFLDRPGLEARPPNQRFRIGRKAMLGEYDTKIGVGGWYYTASFDDLSETQPDGQPVRHHGSSGFYALIDRLLYKNPDRPDQKLTVFVQSGIGDDRVNRFGRYLGAGLTVSGLLEGRGADELGVGLAYARNGSHYMSLQRMQGISVTNAEKTIELTYLIQINSWLALQPDLQYIIRPDTAPSIPNALAFQLRFEVMF
ncbi:MAG TPA: carbohydrate porin [Caldimonas sp.]|jgi:porin